MDATSLLTWTFRGLALAIWLGLPLISTLSRGRRYGMFSLVTLTLSIPGGIALHARLLELASPGVATAVAVAFVWAIVATGLHLAGMNRARLRSWPYRIGVSVVGQAYTAGGLLAGLWLLALSPLRGTLGWLEYDTALESLRWLDLIPVAIALASVRTSTRLAPEVVRVPLAEHGPEEVERVAVKRYRRREPQPLEQRPLRIVQITDPHLGPWQPIAKLRRCMEELVAREPDLILLTGDFLTMEGRGSPGALALALEPLAAASGRTFAIFGNHDHEAPEEVRSALEKNGVSLLIDDEATVKTPAGNVQIVGADYVGRDRDKHIRGLLERFPRRPDHVRIFLLHDPLGFKFVPKGDADLTLSGHTHGGQLGLVSFGLDWTVLKGTQWPDHGLFGHGPNRLYVHRGTGFYGFPLRIGVPGEASLLEVHR
jgi:predicted MPP superfamily phosphohydrolase